MPEFSNYVESLDAASTTTGTILIPASHDGDPESFTPAQIVEAGGGGGGTWGSITGTLSDQTDLQTALNAKAATSDIIGVNDLFISAEAMKPQITNGCGALTQIELATSLVNLGVLPFDATAQEFAQFQIVLPRRYNNSTVTVAPVWTATSGSGTVQWGFSFGSYRNDDALTVALGTPQTSDDTLIATNDFHIGPDSSAITPSGTIADGNLLVGRVSRNPASDTLSADALLIGIIIRVTVDAAKDA